MEVDSQMEAAIQAFITALASHDNATHEQLLAADVRATTDAGGEFLAARRIVAGRDNVIALFHGINRGGAGARWVEFRSINGEPALVADLNETGRRTAKRMVLHVELDDAGRICEVQIVFASRKLGAVDFRGPRVQPVH